MPMPYQYIVEMIMDRIAASKVYLGGSYTDESPLTYYYGGTDKAPIHEETKRILEEMLIMLAKRGEEETFRYMKEELKRRKNKAGKEGNKTKDMQQRRPVE